MRAWPARTPCSPRPRGGGTCCPWRRSRSARRPAGAPAAHAPAADPPAPLPDSQRPAPHPAQDPDATRIDLDWLREQYLTWHRTLADIAAEAGCTAAALKKFAHEHDIPVRPRGTTGYMNAAAASGFHPSQIPEPLRQALHGPQATQRLRRLLLIAQHPSIPRAAQANSIADNTLYTQVARIERDCGGPVINRRPKTRTTGNLTPLGERLCQQARDYLGLTAASPAHQEPAS